MKKIGLIFASVLLCALLAVAAAAADVYVTDGGSGDGTSASAPMGSMTAAIEKIASTGGTVHIVGTYTCADQYEEPAHKGDIVITGGTYAFDNGNFNRWFLAGPGSTTFENITFTYKQGKNNLIVANYNKLVIGEGVTFPNAEGNQCFIIGGYQRPNDVKMEEYVETRKDNLNSDITVKSGNIYCVAGFNRGSGTVNFYGTSNITVEGGNITHLYAANIQGNYAKNGVVTVKGGTINKLFMGGDATRRMNGDSTVHMYGGTVNTLCVNNVLGKATVNFYGGTVGAATQSMAAFSDKPDTAGASSVLNATESVNIAAIAAAFDTLNTVEAPASAAKTVLKLTIGQKVAYVNGEEKTLDAAPIIKNSRTMLPVRFVAENLGGTVGWDGATSTVTIKGEGIDIAMQIGASTAKINGETVTLDSPAFIESSRTSLPVRVVAEAMGAEVAWDGATSTATLTK